ncbi:MAG: hypothetical protein WCA28_23505, partial [Bradyrhizobium sp.]
MSAQGQFQIDSIHCHAICDEIGERMRAIHGRQLPPASPYLQSLIDRLCELDREAGPSIVPSMEDMTWQPAATSRSRETARTGVRG